MGGGAEVDQAFDVHVRPLLAGGDVVVLRATGTDAYNDYLLALLAADSVETLVVDGRAEAASDYVQWAVETAELVWIAGGNQSTYLNAWRDTGLEQAIRHVYDKGGVVGGTSAGHAVLGEIIYDPDGVAGATSAEAVSNPCHESILLSPAFVDLPWMGGAINDSHFEERERMGRLLTFMARVGAPDLEPSLESPVGIGIDERTALFIGADGRAVTEGSGAVYILRQDSLTERAQVACGEPVKLTNMLRYRLRSGDTFDFSDGTSPVSPIRVGVDGESAEPYNPPDPYE
jgi:cyanophycinase